MKIQRDITRALLVVLCSLLVSPAAGLELSRLFTDDMVLQRDQAVPVWGWAEPDAEVQVAFAGQAVKTVAGEDGKWVATLEPLELSKDPQQLTVSSGGKAIVRNNVLVGDVWLCGGQSNMEMGFDNPRMPADLPDFVKPDDHPMIRHLRVVNVRGKGRDKVPGLEPSARLEAQQVRQSWQISSEATYSKFSATGYLFAYCLNKELDIPIGLLNITQGNTRIDMWMSPASAQRIKEHVPTESLRAVYSKIPFTNYNTMIAPSAGFAIKGAIWYQGEANGKEGDSYYWKLKALVQGWREAWGQGDFPFYYVQLPSYNGKRSWAPIREAQRKAMTIPNTGMVVLTDAGDNGAEFPINLHPRNKYVVGQRLAKWALAKQYGKDDLVYSGPLFKDVLFDDGKAVVSFDHVGGGLVAAKKQSPRSNEPPKPFDSVDGFELAGKDGKWYSAKAQIRKSQVIVSADNVPVPTAVRYLYSMNTDHGTLYNAEGLPASPFIVE